MRTILRVVSIHAPVRGATEGWGKIGYQAPVSIHAPVRGATFTLGTAASAGFGFNPRARAGRDDEGHHVGLTHITFQSTRPCGARP